jgi:hypothetical protein
MPSRLPCSRLPSIQLGAQPVNFSSCIAVTPSTSRRGTARISAMVMSAVSSVRTPGVLVTRMPLSVAGLDVDIVDAGAEIGDQLELRAGLGDQDGVDTVGDGGNQDLGGGHGLGQRRRVHRRVVQVQPRVEQFAHARLHRFRQLRVTMTSGFLVGMLHSGA